MESLDGSSSNSDDSLNDFGDQYGVSDLGLREDPGSLLSFLRARRETVAKGRFRSIPGLSLHMELKLHDLMIFQLDRELTCHQLRVSNLEDRLSKRIRRSGELVRQVEELFEAVKRLQKEKLELTEGLLVRLEELKKVKEDVSLCEAVDEKIMEIDSLRTQLDQEVMEKLKLCGRARELEVSSCQHEHATEDLRAEVDLNDRNRKYWQELQDPCFESRRGCTQGGAGVQGEGVDGTQLP